MMSATHEEQHSSKATFLSGRIGKVVASHAAVARSVPALRLH